MVLGHGIGGSIALDMVQRHDIDGLILHAPVGTRLEKRWFPRLMKPEPVRTLIKWGISSRVTRPLIGRRFFSRNVPTDYRNQFLDEYGRADSFSQMFDIITPEWWNGLGAGRRAVAHAVGLRRPGVGCRSGRRLPGVAAPGVDRRGAGLGPLPDGRGAR